MKHFSNVNNSFFEEITKLSSTPLWYKPRQLVRPFITHVCSFCMNNHLCPSIPMYTFALLSNVFRHMDGWFVDLYLLFSNNLNFTNLASQWSYPPSGAHIFFIELLNWDKLFWTMWGRFELGPLGIKLTHRCEWEVVRGNNPIRLCIIDTTWASLDNCRGWDLVTPLGGWRMKTHK